MILVIKLDLQLNHNMQGLSHPWKACTTNNPQCTRKKYAHKIFIHNITLKHPTGIDTVPLQGLRWKGMAFETVPECTIYSRGLEAYEAFAKYSWEELEVCSRRNLK